MKEQILQKYVEKITKDYIKKFANSNSISLCDDEINILYEELKKKLESFSIWKSYSNF